MNTFVLLAAIALTAWRLSGGAPNRWRTGTRDATIVAVTLGMMLAVGVTGAMTALGDTLFPSASLAEGIRQDFVATSHFLVRLRVIHPALALATALVVLFSASALARRRPSRPTVALAGLTRVLVIVQVVGGFANLAMLAPTWMQLVHLLLADLTWLSLVLLGAAALAEDGGP
jgi:heme A synthase